MKPEPLDLSWIQEEVLEDNRIQEYYVGECKKGINATIYITLWIIEKRIRTACNFYRKYVSRPDLLAEEHPELAKIEIDYESADDVLKEIKRIEDVYGINGTQATIRDKLMDYNLWLFKLAFRAVLYTKTVRGWIK